MAARKNGRSTVVSGALLNGFAEHGPGWSLHDAEAALLEKHGLKYDIEEVPIEKITFVKQHGNVLNPARLGAAIKPEYVQELAMALKRGDVLPPPVLATKPDDDWFHNWNGNHRVAAHRAVGSKTVVSAVVRDCLDEGLWEYIPFALNDLNGMRNTTAERLEMAKKAVLERGATCVLAAEMFGVSNTAIMANINDDKAIRELMRLGFDPKRYCQSSRVELAKLLKNANIFKEVAAITRDMTGEEAKAVIKQVTAARTEGEVVAAAKLLGRRNKPTTAHRNGKPVKSPRSNRAAALNSSLCLIIKSLDGVSDIRQLGVTDADTINDYLETVKAAHKALGKVLSGTRPGGVSTGRPRGSCDAKSTAGRSVVFGV